MRAALSPEKPWCRSPECYTPRSDSLHILRFCGNSNTDVSGSFETSPMTTSGMLQAFLLSVSIDMALWFACILITFDLLRWMCRFQEASVSYGTSVGVVGYYVEAFHSIGHITSPLQAVSSYLSPCSDEWLLSWDETCLYLKTIWFLISALIAKMQSPQFWY